MATSPFSNELRDEETFSGFDASASDETFELERLDALPVGIQQETLTVPEEVAAPVEVLPPIENIPSPPPAVELPATEEIDIIDRELLAMLEAELEGSRQTTSTPVTPEVPPPAPFVELEDVEQADAFDFSEIDAQHPSKYMTQKETPVVSQEDENMGGYSGYAAMAGSGYSQPIPEPIEQKDEEAAPRNRRVIYMVAAGVLLAFGIGSAVYVFWPNLAHLAGLTDGKDSLAHTESMVKPLVASHDDDKSHAEQHKSPESEASHSNLASADNHAKEESHQEEHHPAAESTTESKTAHAQQEAKSAADANPHETTEKSTPTIAKHIEKTVQPPHKKKVVEHTESEATEAPPKPAPKKNIANEEHTPAKVRETVSPKVTKNSAKQKSKSEGTSAGLTANNEATNQVYTVQVYSTPSKDDAEEWLDQLRSKQIVGGFVSNQTVRGQTWYRVRFGAYPSREEAENAARRNGFSKSWIDRIK